jgi:hypothetical protein
MNKRVTLPDSALSMGRYYVSYARATRETWSPDAAASPQTSMAIQQGYYKPTKNPEIWSFVGDYKPDPWKSYERKAKKWERDLRKLMAIFPPSTALNMIGPRPERPRV